MFQDEFCGLVAYLASGTGESVIVGDFNYHFDCTSCPHVKQLQTLFSDNCLTQLIRDPTHCRGHILDWMVERENNGSVSQCNILSTSFSDRDAIVGLNYTEQFTDRLPSCEFQKPEKNQLSRDGS